MLGLVAPLDRHTLYVVPPSPSLGPTLSEATLSLASIPGSLAATLPLASVPVSPTLLSPLVLPMLSCNKGRRWVKACWVSSFG